MIILVIIGLLLIFDLLWLWQGDRLLRGCQRGWGWRMAHALFVLLLMAGFLGMILERAAGWPLEPPKLWVVAVYIWHLLFLPPLLALTLAGQTLRLARWLGSRVSRLFQVQPVAPAEEEGTSRREFLITAAVVLPPLLLGGSTIYGAWQIRHFRTRTLEVPVPGLPPDLDGFKIAHLTDSHSGRFTGARMLARFASETNRVGADLAVFTGDLINDALADLPPAIEMLKSLETRHGVYVCEGNHDLIEDRFRFEQDMRDAGINLLVNEVADFDAGNTPVSILGLRWGRGLARLREDRNTDRVMRENLIETLLQMTPGRFPILLSHHPHAFEPAAEFNIPLTLAGHTHGGQLMVNDEFGFGPAMFRYWTGLYQKGSSSLVVSNGIGNWFPLRTAAPAELAVVVLRQAG